MSLIIDDIFNVYPSLCINYIDSIYNNPLTFPFFIKGRKAIEIYLNTILILLLYLPKKTKFVRLYSLLLPASAFLYMIDKQQLTNLSR